MKKLAILSMTFLFTVAALKTSAWPIGNETKNEAKTESTLPANVSKKTVSEFPMNSFYEDFGKVQNLIWKKSGPFEEATFIQDGQKLTAFYDNMGQLVGTTSIKAFSELPANGQKEINAGYGDYTVESVIFYDYNEANDAYIPYENSFDDKDNFFVEMEKDGNKIILQVTPEGFVSFFKTL